jgi:hypothetical protein
VVAQVLQEPQETQRLLTTIQILLLLQQQEQQVQFKVTQVLDMMVQH